MTYGSLRPGRYFAVLGATVRRDPLVKTAILFFIGGGIATIFLGALEVPGDAAALAWLRSRAGYLGELVLLALVVLGLVQGLGEISGHEERKFWRRVTFAFTCWLLGSAVRFVPELPGSLPQRPFQVVFYAFLYIFMIRAVEGEPHRPAQPMESVAERLLTWPSVTFFVLGLVIYFVFIPTSVHWRAIVSGAMSDAANRRDEYYLYTVLDLYLSLRFLFLARAAGARRWRSIYFTLAQPWIVLVLVNDLSVIASLSRFFWPLERLPLWWMCAPVVVQLVAVRLRHQPFPGAWEASERDAPVTARDDLTFLVSARTLALGVVFPVLHILVTRYDLVDAPGHGARQALVLVWLAFFGAVALFQHRHLERRAQELWLDRARFEEALRASEQDLRLIIEKDRASAMLCSAEKKFDLIFHSCPYTLVITSLEDGRFIEVNPAFEETFGYAKDEVLGKPISEFGLWLEPGAQARLHEHVKVKKLLREVEIRFRHRDGGERVARVSAAEIRAGGEACLLSIVHDVTDRCRAEERLEAAAEVLDRAAAAIFEIGGDGRVRTWNSGAERLTGWTAEEVVGRPAEDLTATAAAAWSGFEDDHVWSGDVELVRRGGERLRLAGWRAGISGSGGASLMIVAEGAGGSRRAAEEYSE